MTEHVHALHTLITAALGAHIAHGDPATFTWALYRTPEGSLAVAIAAGNPPRWEDTGDADGLAQAKAALAQALAHAPFTPETLPAQIPAVSWQFGGAHARMAHRRVFADLARALA